MTTIRPTYPGTIQDLLEAVDRMGKILSELDSDNTWGSMTCTEVESVSDVLRAAGYAEGAAMIIDLHAGHDEDGDLHYVSNSENENKEDGK